MYIKVCGLVNTAQIDHAVSLGYDAVGVVTYPKSKRFCPPEVAKQLARHAQGKVDTFVVGKSYTDVKEAADAFDYIQIYEPIRLPNLVFASKAKPPADLAYVYFMYDGSVGSGVFQEFPLWIKELETKVIVAGGLTSKNVGEVIRKINPFGVDISSGVEREGVKDFKLMEEFIFTVRSFDGQNG